MAIDETPESIETLHPSKARLAGLFGSAISLAISIALSVWIIRLLASVEDQSGLAIRLLPLLGLALVGLVAGGVFAFARGVGAQQFLLVYWVALLVAAITAALAGSLWELSPEQAEAFGLGAKSARLTVVLSAMGLLVVGFVVVGLLTAASKPGSRQRYACMVVLSISLAVAAVLAVNLLAEKMPLHANLETLGRYGMSGRTKKILDALPEPVTLTCVYTSDDADMKAEDYRPRVMELLGDMALYSDKVEVNNVTTDAGKARLLARLRDKLGTQADEHRRFVQDFSDQAEALQAKLERQAEAWRAHPAESYLNQWGLAVKMSSALDEAIKQFGQARQKVKAAREGGGLPDYASLVRDIRDSEQAARDVLDNSASLVDSVGKIAAAASDPNTRKTVLDEVKTFRDAVAAMSAAIQSGGADPNDPAAVLNRYVTAARAAAKQSTDLAKALDNIAGPDLAGLVQQNSNLTVAMGPVALPLTVYLQQGMGTMLKEAAEQADAVVKNTKADYQKRFIAETRQEDQRNAASADQIAKLIEEAVNLLGTVDEHSAKAFASAKGGKLFADTLARIDATLAAADKLPELKDTSISTDIAGDNIVIVESGRKAEVVPFGDVWPLKVQPMGMAPPEPGARKREFHGDAAISSRVLDLTSEPFALVIFAYFGAGPDMPPQMAQMMPPADLPVTQFNELRRRLEAANFAVEDWNLSGPMPDPNEHKGRQKVLVVLPPAPAMPPNPMQRVPMPRFGPDEEKKVTDAIADGIPAVFLTTFSPPRQMGMFMPPGSTPYAWGNYLLNTWGIDVQTSYLVVPAVTDEQMPGRFKVDAERFNYLPLSSFTDQPIGKPLQGQRVMWSNLCPIQRKLNARREPAPPPEGVTIQPVLTVPATEKATWATRRIQDLLMQFRTSEGSYITPDYGAGDLPVPFDLAVAATKAENTEKNVKPTRIVVLSVAASLTDGYLDREVPVRDAKGTLSLDDPPRANADLPINSIYWLVGRPGLIAAGPARATIREIPPATKNLLIVAYCVVLPLVVLGIGGIVLYRRTRI